MYESNIRPLGLVRGLVVSIEAGSESDLILPLAGRAPMEYGQFTN